MTNEEILEMASHMGNCPDDEEIITFARLVQKKQREIDAFIAEDTAAGRDAEVIAAAILAQED